MRKEFGADPYLIGDDLFGGGVNAERAKLWDAITDYDVYGTVLQSKGSTRCRAALADIYAAAQKALAPLDVGFVPAATPGFNDRAVRGGHPAAPRYLTDVADADDGSLFAGMLDREVLPNRDARHGEMIMITSFNEWHEDTQIEPTNMAPATREDDSGNNGFVQGNRYAGYGELYLDILSKRAK